MGKGVKDCRGDSCGDAPICSSEWHRHSCHVITTVLLLNCSLGVHYFIRAFSYMSALLRVVKRSGCKHFDRHRQYE